MQGILLPSLLATIEFGRGDFDKTISLLQPVTKYEMGSVATLDPGVFARNRLSEIEQRR